MADIVHLALLLLLLLLLQLLLFIHGSNYWEGSNLISLSKIQKAGGFLPPFSSPSKYYLEIQNSNATSNRTRQRSWLTHARRWHHRVSTIWQDFIRWQDLRHYYFFSTTEQDGEMVLEIRHNQEIIVSLLHFKYTFRCIHSTRKSFAIHSIRWASPSFLLRAN